MSETTIKEVPAHVQDWIGKERYQEEGEFPVERGYIWTACASVEMGNPLYWDDKAAEEITDGVIAPPTMISTWFRPHHWAPGRTKQALPLQVPTSTSKQMLDGRATTTPERRQMST